MRVGHFFKLFGLFLVCLLITSGCGQEDEKGAVKDLPFVVFFDQTEQRFLLRSVSLRADSVDMILYSADIANSSGMRDGLCGIGDFSIDFQNKVNSKYYNAEVLVWRETLLSEFNIVEDPDNVQGDSLTVSWSKGCSFIGHILFLKLTQVVLTGAEYSYDLSYDALEPPVENTFILDLNAIMTQQDTDTTSVSKTIGLTFDLKDFFTMYADRDTFGFVINYISGLTNVGLNKYDKYKLPVPLTSNPVEKK